MGATSSRDCYMKKIVTLCLLFFVLSADIASAGFGITPPYVRNTSLTRNSTYEQQILLVRGNPDVPQKAQVSIDAPEIIDWIEIVEGDSVPLPRGVQKVPMTVRIKVPSDADFKDYNGTIRIKTVPDDDQVSAGAVSISLGAQVDIALTVIDREILEFRIFDFAGKVLLEETQNKNKVRKIAPYATEEVFAEIPTRLPAGNYIARFKVYNGEEVKQEGEVSLSVLPYGTLQQAGFGFSGLSVAHKISILLPILALIILVIYIFYNRRLGRRRGE